MADPILGDYYEQGPPLGEHHQLFEAVSAQYDELTSARDIGFSALRYVYISPEIDEPFKETVDDEGNEKSFIARNWGAYVQAQLVTYLVPERRLDALVLKRDEYGERLKHWTAADQQSAREDPNFRMPALYGDKTSWAWVILSALLQKGSLEFSTLHQSVEAVTAHLFKASYIGTRRAFYGGYSLVSDYSDGRYKHNVSGGTGLAYDTEDES